MRNNYIKKVLKNGVKLYLYIDSNMRKTYVDFAIDYGSNGKYFKFYYKNKLYKVGPGVAHFLEHLLGEHSKYGNLYKVFNDKKYEVNGGTSLNYTRYYFCGTKDIKESIKELINAIEEPIFTKEDVENSRKAIIEETKNPTNDKYSQNSFLAFYNSYKDLNIIDLTLSGIGNEQTTLNIDYDTLKLCYDAFYYDENKSILIAGNFDEEEMTNYIESIYDKIKPHKKMVKNYTYLNLDKYKRRKEIRYTNLSKDLVTISFKEKNTLKLSNLELDTYIKFLISSKLLQECKFVDNLVKQNILSHIWQKTSFIVNEEYFNIIISSSVKDTDVYLKKLKKELKINNFNEDDFNLFKKSIIADEAGKIDFKYSIFKRFHGLREYTENFDDIDFYKSISFNKFLEFYNELSFKDYTISIFKDESSKI